MNRLSLVCSNYNNPLKIDCRDSGVQPFQRPEQAFTIVFSDSVDVGELTEIISELNNQLPIEQVEMLP